MKILFLDFDGVLNSTESCLEKRIPTGGVMGLDAYHVAKLQKIVDATGAAIVVSSTWRIIHDVGALRRLLEANGFRGPVIARTPNLSKRTGRGMLYRSVERGHEIAAWLAESAREIGSFAILDDDSDAGVVHPERFVRVEFERGLQDEHVERVIKILGRSA